MIEKYWQEVSMIVSGELAEAVAEVLGRYIPDGVVIESTAVTAGPSDENGQAVGPMRVCGYIPVDGQVEETRQRIEQGLWYLGRISALPEPEFKLIREVNWMEAWKEHYHPIPVGNRLLIVPDWIDAPQGERIPIRMELGMAFGTGTHPTTQLCLMLIEEYIRDLRRPSEVNVIDIGCGSGILAIAALKLGAERALGVDIDAEAVRAAGKNAAINDVSDQLETGMGSVKEVRAAKFDLQKAQFVLANILAPILVQLLDAGLGELVLQGGRLILSGILAEQCQEVEQALEKHGFAVVDVKKNGDWVAIAATH